MIILSNLGTVDWRYTPWDQRVFGMKTVELLNIDATNFALAEMEIAGLEKLTEADFIYGRVDSRERNTIKLLTSLGYYNCETTLQVTLARLQKYELPKIYAKRSLTLEQISENDLENIAVCAGKAFFHTRFHEDPFLDNELCNKRIEFWVKDLFTDQAVNNFTYRNGKGEITSFMFWRRTCDVSVELILGGSFEGFGLYAPYFWGSIISNFKSSGINKISTTISAANLGVLSLYTSLGFSVSNTKFDFHKILKAE